MIQNQLNKNIEEFEKERTDAITEMFDNKYADGIYPTSVFFQRIDKALKHSQLQLLQAVHAELDIKRVQALRMPLEVLNVNLLDKKIDWNAGYDQALKEIISHLTKIINDNH